MLLKSGSQFTKLKAYFQAKLKAKLQKPMARNELNKILNNMAE